MRIGTRITAWGREVQSRYGFTAFVGACSVIAIIFILIPHAALAQTTASNPLATAASVVGGGIDWLLTPLGAVIFKISNLLLALTGKLFNLVLDKTVFGFAEYLGNLPGILAAWQVMRDVSNIALLFGFIFIGVTTILDIHGYEAKKTLPRLIIFAVLLNFSLLASQAIIDTSNIFSKILYEQSGASCPAGISAQECATSYGVSSMIMATTGGGSVFNNPGASPGLVEYIALSIFAVVLMLVLLAGALLLISRAIILVFLMALSPIGFAGLAIPPLASYAKQWWHTLIGQAFFAPVYLLLIFVGLKISESLKPSGSLASALASGANARSGFDSILVFTIASGFMIGALIIAKQMSQQGATSIISSVQKGVGTVVLGSAGFVGRRTVGRAGHAAGHALRSTALGRTELGRVMAGGLDKVGHGSFDLRSSKLAGAVGIDNFGKGGGEGGYHHILDEGKKKREEYAKSLTISHHDQDHLDNLRLQSFQMGRDIAQMDADIAQAQAAGNQALVGQLTQMRDAHTQVRNQIRAQAANLAGREQDMQAEYAANLANSPFNVTLFNNRVATTGTRSRTSSAAAIRNRLAESPEQRLMRQLNNALQGQQAAAPAAAGGHGAPAAPAAAAAPHGPAPAAGHHNP